jgi:hypothetical protein
MHAPGHHLNRYTLLVHSISALSQKHDPHPTPANLAYQTPRSESLGAKAKRRLLEKARRVVLRVEHPQHGFPQLRVPSAFSVDIAGTLLWRQVCRCLK